MDLTVVSSSTQSSVHFLERRWPK